MIEIRYQQLNHLGLKLGPKKLSRLIMFYIFCGLYCVDSIKTHESKIRTLTNECHKK